MIQTLRQQYALWVCRDTIIKAPFSGYKFGLSRGYVLEKEMATHSSVLAWRIPWTEKPGRLQSMESHRVGHD